MDPTLQQLGRAVKQVQHGHHRALDGRLGAELGISLVQWDALRHIAANPGLSQHQLAELTFQSDQSFGTLLTRMIGRGLIERLPGPGRALRHTLTPLGRRLLEAGNALADEMLAESFGPLTGAERSTLHALLTLVLEGKNRVGQAPRGGARPS